MVHNHLITSEPLFSVFSGIYRGCKFRGYYHALDSYLLHRNILLFDQKKTKNNRRELNHGGIEKGDCYTHVSPGNAERETK